MKQIRIGIAEDEIIIADSIRSVLQRMNYFVLEPCISYAETLEMLETGNPDLVLLDINLNSAPLDGIALGAHIRKYKNLPFIFLTANSDQHTLDRAKAVYPNAFLVKPFSPGELHASIEIAIANFKKSTTNAKTEDDGYFFIKDGSVHHKIAYKEVLYIECDHIYIAVYTAARKYLVRTSLQQYLEKLNGHYFVRIHRSYVVNPHKIEKILPNFVQIQKQLLPVSKRYKEALLNHIKQ